MGYTAAMGFISSGKKLMAVAIAASTARVRYFAFR